MGKRILFVTPSFRNGGTISCLKSLLPFLSQKGFVIDLLALSHDGPNMEMLSQYCNIVPLFPGAAKKDGGDSFFIKIARFSKHFLAKMGFDLSKRAFMPVVNRLKNENYDYIVGFQEGTVTHFVSFFATDNLISWVHCDYSRVVNKNNRAKEKRTYRIIQKIVFVSNYTRGTFTSVFPELINKTQVIHNFIDYERIRDLSKEPAPAFFSGVNKMVLVSIGRIDPIKQFSSIPEIAKKLYAEELDFIWYIIGKGATDEENRILDAIARNGMSNNILMTGNLDNPFPLMKQAKYLVCTSKSEAYPNVIREALALGVPSIVNNFGSAREVVNDGHTGIICSLDKMAETIISLEKNEKEYFRLRDNCRSDYSENNIIGDQLLQLFEQKR